MTDARRAALVLHGLAPVDRDWMLARLPEPQADRLRDLLDELRGLGIPADADLLRSAIGDGARAPADPPRHASLSRASAEELHALLCNEPDRLIAVVVSGAAWPWKEALLERLGPARAQRIRELARHHTAGAALRGEVLEGLSQRIARREADPIAATPRLTAWRGLLGRWQAWTR